MNDHDRGRSHNMSKPDSYYVILCQVTYDIIENKMYIIFNYVMLCHLLYVLFFLLFFLLFFFWLLCFYYVTVISIIISIIFDNVTDSHPNLKKLADANSRPMRGAMTVKCPWAPAKLRDQQESSLYPAKSTFEAD